LALPGQLWLNSERDHQRLFFTRAIEVPMNRWIFIFVLAVFGSNVAFSAPEEK
jgi:hypothetical protein